MFDFSSKSILVHNGTLKLYFREREKTTFQYYTNMYKFFTYVTKTHTSGLIQYPHIVENPEITMAPLFLRLIRRKSLTQSIKIFVKLDFFTNVLVDWIVFVYNETY